MTLAVPCLIFVSLMQTEDGPAGPAPSSPLPRLWPMLGSLRSHGRLTLGLGLDRRTYLAPLIFGNTGNLGLPLALFAFGDVGLSNAIVVFAIMAVLSFTFGIWLVSGSGSPSKVLGEPMVAATLLGALFLWQGWETPTFVTNTLSLIGQMAIPLMLITLGVAVARLTPQGILRAAALSFVKLLICTGIAWVTARYFTLDRVAFGVLVLQIATPCRRDVVFVG